MVMTDCNPLRGISPRFLPLCTLRNWCLENPRFLSQRPPSLTTQHVWTALRGLGLLTAGRVRDITAASLWRPASTQRRCRKRPDAHGDVVGAPCLPRALHSLERMSTPPCQERVVRPCKEQRYRSADWPWRHQASGRRPSVSWPYEGAPSWKLY